MFSHQFIDFLVEIARTALALWALSFITVHAIWHDLLERISSNNSYCEGMKQVFQDLLNQGKKKNKKLKKTVHEVAVLEGYNVENHTIETQDGFLLTMHRLQPMDSKTTHPTKGPVLLQHGLYQSSMLYVMNQRKHGLAYILADTGYDVWLGNNRGNVHSRNHTCYSPKDKQFWEWGVDELAHDVEANIHYILQYTGEAKVAYIGHSQGCAQALASFSSNQAIRQKVNSCILLAPGAFVQTMPCIPLRGLAALASKKPHLFYFIFGERSFLPFMESIRKVLPQKTFSYIAYTVFKYLFQWGDGYWDKSRNDLFFAETPAGTSSRTIVQWMQQSISGKFQWFCYHKNQVNLIKYGEIQAPEYPLHKMDIPTAIFYGGQDDLLDYTRLIQTLPNCVFHKCIQHHGHLDSVIATDANLLVFPDILNFLAVYTKNSHSLSLSCPR